MPVTSESSSPKWDTFYHVDRWQAGEGQAFEALFRHFSPLLRRRVQRSRHWGFLGARMEVDDAVQVIWAQVWDYAGTNFESRGPGSFYGLVGSIADRVLISLLRDGRAQKRGEGRKCEALSTENARHVTLRPGLPSEPTPTSVARTNEDRRRLQLLLSEEQYTVFYDIEVRGLTAEDVSLVLDKTPSAVRSILRRAKLRLVQGFEEEKG